MMFFSKYIVVDPRMNLFISKTFIKIQNFESSPNFEPFYKHLGNNKSYTKSTQTTVFQINSMEKLHTNHVKFFIKVIIWVLFFFLGDPLFWPLLSWKPQGLHVGEIRFEYRSMPIRAGYECNMSTRNKLKRSRYMYHLIWEWTMKGKCERTIFSSAQRYRFSAAFTVSLKSN